MRRKYFHYVGPPIARFAIRVVTVLLVVADLAVVALILFFPPEDPSRVLILLILPEELPHANCG